MDEIDQTEPDNRRRLTNDEPNVANGADVKQAPTLAGNSHPEQQEDLGNTCSQCKGSGQLYSYISGWYNCPRCNTADQPPVQSESYFEWASRKAKDAGTYMGNAAKKHTALGAIAAAVYDPASLDKIVDTAAEELDTAEANLIKVCEARGAQLNKTRSTGSEPASATQDEILARASEKQDEILARVVDLQKATTRHEIASATAKGAHYANEKAGAAANWVKDGYNKLTGNGGPGPVKGSQLIHATESERRRRLTQSGVEQAPTPDQPPVQSESYYEWVSRKAKDAGTYMGDVVKSHPMGEIAAAVYDPASLDKIVDTAAEELETAELKLITVCAARKAQLLDETTGSEPASEMKDEMLAQALNFQKAKKDHRIASAAANGAHYANEKATAAANWVKDGYNKLTGNGGSDPAPTANPAKSDNDPINFSDDRWSSQ